MAPPRRSVFSAPPPVRRRGLTAPAVGAALPDLAIAGVFLSTWLRPDSVQPGLAKTLVLVMLLGHAWMPAAPRAAGSPA